MSVDEEGFERVTDRLQIAIRQEISDLIAICHPFVTLPAHHAGMNQHDQLFSPHDDSAARVVGHLAEPTTLDVPAHADSSKPDKRAMASDTLTSPTAGALVGVGPVETIDTSDATAWDPSSNRRRTYASKGGAHTLVWQSRAQQDLPRFIEDKGTLARVASLVSSRAGSDGLPPDLRERDSSAKTLTSRSGASRRASLEEVRSKKLA